jgi:hypothetical protein
MWTLPSRSVLNRHRCYKCFEDLTNKPSIGERRGNKCIRCYCQKAEIDEECFWKAIANRCCCKCGRVLVIEPAIVESAIKGLPRWICFPCCFLRDRANEQAAEKIFWAEKQLYEEWESRYGVQWRKLEERAKSIEGFAGAVAVVTFIILAYLAFDSTNEWNGERVAIFFAAIVGANIAHYLAKEAASGLFNKPTASSIPKPPPEPQPPEKRALCGYPELLFDGNKEADLNPKWVDFEYGEPLDWEERRKVCKQRDKFFCCLCGEKQRLHVHHVIPKGKFYKGSHSLQNLITLCQRHHSAQEYYDHKYLMEKSRSRKF